MKPADQLQAVYLSGTPFINMPWSSDGFGALDFTLLDHHHGRIEDWRALVNEMHRRGMYVIQSHQKSIKDTYSP